MKVVKGQFVFEFLIAGVIFFAVVLYAMNYLSANVSDFRGKFYMDKLQSKALQISSILLNEKSPMGVVESPHVFNMSKIDGFDTKYCGATGDYTLLRKNLDLIEKTDYGERVHNINITLTKASGVPLLSCGYTVPGGARKAEMQRFGILNEDRGLVILKMVVW